MKLQAATKSPAELLPAKAVDAAPLKRLRVNVPWSEVTGWTAHGVDGKGRQVRQSASYRPGAAPAQSAATSAFDVSLPPGFKGLLQINGSGRLPLGTVRLDMSSDVKAGEQPLPARPGQTQALTTQRAAQSHEMDVLWLGPAELLVDRLGHQTQCYVQLPPVLGVRHLVTRPTVGQGSSFAATARGASFTLPADFRGTIEAVDAAGVVKLGLRIRYLFPVTRGIDVLSVAEPYRASIGRQGGILQVNLVLGGSRSSIA